MSNPESAAALSLAFRQLSDALHVASVACKDLEYTIPLLAANAISNVTSTPQPQPTTTKEKPEKGKRVKDPNEPRRPPSAYLVFTSKARKELVANNPHLKPPEVMSRLAGMWGELDEARKRVSVSRNTTHY